jgi:predicted phosphodiesterase
LGTNRETLYQAKKRTVQALARAGIERAESETEWFLCSLKEISRSRADLVITGHTHVGSLVREGRTWFLNPGGASLPRGRDPASVALIEESIIQIITLDGELLHYEIW